MVASNPTTTNMRASEDRSGLNENQAERATHVNQQWFKLSTLITWRFLSLLVAIATIMAHAKEIIPLKPVHKANPENISKTIIDSSCSHKSETFCVYRSLYPSNSRITARCDLFILMNTNQDSFNQQACFIFHVPSRKKKWKSDRPNNPMLWKSCYCLRWVDCTGSPLGFTVHWTFTYPQ